jgi:hypothetical protein
MDMRDSTEGHWLSPDPLAGDISNPQSLNRYAYVLNNPTTLTDPLGLQGHFCPPYTKSLGTEQCVGFQGPGSGNDRGTPFEDVFPTSCDLTVEGVRCWQTIDLHAALDWRNWHTTRFVPSTFIAPQPNAADNEPNPRLLNIAQQVQNCAQFSNVGNQLAQGIYSGRISVGNVPSNAVATTNGWFHATSVISPDALYDPSIVIHEWIHQTQAAGNPFFLLLKGANQIQSLFTSDNQGFLDYSAQDVANKIVSVCGVK